MVWSTEARPWGAVGMAFMRLASDFAEEHGADACDYAYRAVVNFEAEGEGERAHLWFLLLVMLGDIASYRLNPDRPLTIH
jgi:hypothetical protein